MVVIVIMLAIPIRALADDNEAHFHHDHGKHSGWYKHHGGYDEYYRHHDYDDGYPRYREGRWGYRGEMVCDDDGDRCWSSPPIVVPWQPSFGSLGYSNPGFYGSPYNGSGY